MIDTLDLAIPSFAFQTARLQELRNKAKRVQRLKLYGTGYDLRPKLPLIVYLNRLSDLLFVLARAVNRRAGVAQRFGDHSPGVVNVEVFGAPAMNVV